MSKLIRTDTLFGTWKAEILSGQQPTRFELADPTSPLAKIQAAPGRVLLWAGQPGIGKTALLCQLFIDGLRLNPDLRVLAVNVEMAPEVLLERQLSRLSGIPLSVVQTRAFKREHTERLNHGFDIIEDIGPRLAFMQGPFSIENVAESADEFEPSIICLDYLQRFTVGDDSTDKRGSVGSLMSTVRRFADAGACVFVVSALARQKNSQGRNSYDAETLTMAAFRDSSELEFGADDAYILTRGEQPTDITARHLKSRNGQCEDIALEFDGSIQRFTPTFADDIGRQAESWWANG